MVCDDTYTLSGKAVHLFSKSNLDKVFFNVKLSYIICWQFFQLVTKLSHEMDCFTLDAALDNVSTSGNPYSCTHFDFDIHGVFNFKKLLTNRQTMEHYAMAICVDLLEHFNAILLFITTFTNLF